MATDKSLAELVARLDRLEAAFSSRLPPFADPPPDDFGRFVGLPWWFRHFEWPIPIPRPGDPSPIDLSRLTRAQLQLSLETIKAQRVRLDGVENMIKDQLKQLKG